MRKIFGFPLGALIVAVIGVIPLLPGLSGGFVLDDFENIVKNTALHLAEINNFHDLLIAAYSFEPSGGTRALSMLTFALDIWAFGFDPYVFKVTNLVIHGATSFALGFFLRKILVLVSWSNEKASVAALTIALMWAVHPLQVSSALYIVQRMQTMCTFFVVLSLMSYLKMRECQIEGAIGRVYGFASLLLGLLAFASKEDAVLIPVYFLLIELTVLNFKSASERQALQLKWMFCVFFVVGLLIYALVVIPHYWYFDSYPNRDFSSIERLLTQGRVLWMYMGQILLPLPSLLPFNYDDYVISKGVLNPVSTLPSVIGVFGLLGLSWYIRKLSPVFSLGVFIFFSGHFITSNVVNLELVFEHRNHWPLVGFLLALLGIAVYAARLLRLSNFAVGVLLLAVISSEAFATAQRATIWGDGLDLAEYNLSVASRSQRAWIQLCVTHFRLSNSKPDDPHLQKAIDVCEQGAKALPESVVLMHNVVIYKTVQGTVTEKDWEDFLFRLEHARIDSQNKRILWHTLGNVDLGLFDDEEKVLRVIDVIASRSELEASQYLRVAAYIFNETQQPMKALPFLEKAALVSAEDDPDILKMLQQLQSLGRQDWVDRILSTRNERKDK